MAKNMGRKVVTLDITRDPLEHTHEFGGDDLVMVGVPVYGGRIPALAGERLAKLQGQGTPA